VMPYGPKHCGCCGATEGVEAHHLYLRSQGTTRRSDSAATFRRRARPACGAIAAELTARIVSRARGGMWNAEAVRTALRRGGA
jgi:hypothetical protein